MGFLKVAVALAIKEHRRPKMNSRTRMHLFIKASRVVLRGVRLRKEPLTYYAIGNSLKYGRFTSQTGQPPRRVTPAIM